MSDTESRDFLTMVFMTRHQAECVGHNDQCYFTDSVAQNEADQMLDNMQKNRFALIRIPAVDTSG
jgi:hypothetical protein